jgi:hypothetical protein
MISDNELLAIVQGLLEKTSKDRVGWQQKKKSVTVTPQGVLAECAGDIFQLFLPESVIEIQHVSPRAEPDFITFELRRKSDGQAVAQRQVYDGDVGWDQLFDLYALVSRQVLGWDNVLKDVQSFLNKSGAQPVSG